MASLPAGIREEGSGTFNFQVVLPLLTACETHPNMSGNPPRMT